MNWRSLLLAAAITLSGCDSTPPPLLQDDSAIATLILEKGKDGIPSASVYRGHPDSIHPYYDSLAYAVDTDWFRGFDYLSASSTCDEHPLIDLWQLDRYNDRARKLQPGTADTIQFTQAELEGLEALIRVREFMDPVLFEAGESAETTLLRIPRDSREAIASHRVDFSYHVIGDVRGSSLQARGNPRYFRDELCGSLQGIKRWGAYEWER